jgi:hypothetical protein
MIERVEKNLSFLVPCRISSLAAANGIGEHSHSKNYIQPENEKSADFDLYYSSFNGEFDVYYSSVLSIITNIIIDSSDKSKQQDFSPPKFPFKDSEVRNLNALSIIKSLIKSGELPLIFIGIRTIYSLIVVNSKNVVSLEMSGITATMIELFSLMLRTGNFLFTSESNPGTNENLSRINLCALLSLTSDLIHLLQMIAVITSLKDCSVLSCLMVIFVNFTINGVFLVDDTIMSAHQCHNCESELAILECLNMGYVLLLLFLFLYISGCIFLDVLRNTVSGCVRNVTKYFIKQQVKSLIFEFLY